MGILIRSDIKFYSNFAANMRVRSTQADRPDEHTACYHDSAHRCTDASQCSRSCRRMRRLSPSISGLVVAIAWPVLFQPVTSVPGSIAWTPCARHVQAEKMRWTPRGVHVAQALRVQENANIPLEWMPRAQGAGDAAYDSEIDSLLDSAPGMSDEGEAFPSTSEQTSAAKSYKVTLAQNAAGISVYSIVYSAVLANNAAQRLIRLVLWVLVSWAASPLRLIWSTTSTILGVAARCSSACFEHVPRETARCDERSELQLLSQQNRQRLLERDGMLHQARQPLADTLSSSPSVDQYSTPQEARSHRTSGDLSAGSHVDRGTDTSSGCLEGLSDLSHATSSPDNLQHLRCQVVSGGVASLVTPPPLASRVTKTSTHTFQHNDQPASSRSSKSRDLSASERLMPRSEVTFHLPSQDLESECVRDSSSATSRDSEKGGGCHGLGGGRFKSDSESFTYFEERNSGEIGRQYLEMEAKFSSMLAKAAAELADAQRQLACLARQNRMLTQEAGEQRLQNTQLAVQKSEVEGEVESLRATLAQLQANLAAAENAREKLVCEQIELTSTVQRHEGNVRRLLKANSQRSNAIDTLTHWLPTCFPDT